MKKLGIINLIIIIALSCLPLSTSALSANDTTSTQALRILQRMSLKEKIGQKLMLDFRYWCPMGTANQACTLDFITMNQTVKQIISQNHIGGIILFANNLKTIAQITTLTDAFQQAMQESNNLALLIGTDQEGGIVARLPRDVSVTFPGNMALAAAYLGHSNISYGTVVGKILATDLKAVGINIDFAPVVDVNVNPLNPVINVRSFSDDPKLVAKLGLEVSQAIQAEGIAATLKHFPGHGDTTTDSHIGLPIVNHTLAEAWAIDLYPFKTIIQLDSPDLIMTAHIQYPALDNSQIYAEKAGKDIIAPATLSRKIQYDILRHQLGFQGIVITDALDMGAIAQNFDSTDATIKAFQAGDDIALMPIEIIQPDDANKVADLVAKIEAAVLNGTISRNELDQSVLRIIQLKIKLGLLTRDQTPLSEKITNAQNTVGDKSQHNTEAAITDDAMTLVQNNAGLLPLKLSTGVRIHILTPWLEQGAGIATEITRLQQTQQLPSNIHVTYIRIADTTLTAEKQAIDNADIIIVGNSTTSSSPLLNSERFARTTFPMQSLGTLVFPDIPKGDDNNNSHSKPFLLSVGNDLSEAQFIYQALQYAKDHGKKTIFISLLAPYDLPNYKDVADAMLAGYDFYGYLSDDDTLGYYRGPSMPALTRIIFGISHAKAKLPINIPNPSKPTEIIYQRGYGLTTGN